MLRNVARLLTCLLLLAASPVAAAEYIQSYHSVIELAKSGAMRVTETIKVNAEGRDIRRGIFRDFPLYAQDDKGRRTKVDFAVLSVERDGEPENWHSETVSGGIRIYTGSADVLLRPGEYTYQITYTTDRQIRYFDDHDELYWNVTGNGWQFPIAEASATVVLPDGVKPADTAFYTGTLGATEKNARVMSEGNEVFFSTTRPLPVSAGLTIALSFPKGALLAPDKGQAFWWYLRDNLGTIIGLGGLFLVFVYYLRSWFAVGRDPAHGVMVPRWDAPDGISPALVNYIDNRGFSGGAWPAFSATLLDLAVKGFVVLDDLKTSIIVRRTEKDAGAELPGGQRALLAAVGGAGQTLPINKANGARVQKTEAAFRNAIENEHRNRYYHANSGYIFAGVALSVVTLVTMLIFGDLDGDTVALIIVPVFFSIVIGGFAVGIGKQLRRSRSLVARIGLIIMIAFIGFVAVSVVLGTLASAVFDDALSQHWPLLVAVGGIVLINALFFFLMGAPTPLGQKMTDGIAGLRTYLTLAEKDRMNMAGAPEMSPKHFETLLPYAVALGVEKPWTKTFETWLATAAVGAAAYQAIWYTGAFDGRFSDRIGGFSSGMASTIASTIPEPPRTSSSGFSSGSGGGGGGFSGGGGGGGGGGGW